MKRRITDLHPKIQSAGIGGAVSVVLVWVLSLVGVETPPEVAVSIGAIFSFVFGYSKRSGI